MSATIVTHSLTGYTITLPTGESRSWNGKRELAATHVAMAVGLGFLHASSKSASGALKNLKNIHKGEIEVIAIF